MSENKYLRLRNFAREMRNNPTEAEKKLWSRINRNQILNFKFLRQKIIGNYIVDFYCHAANLVIDVDGGGQYTLHGEKSDAERDKFLKSKGLTVLRFSNTDVHKNIDGVLYLIYEHLSKLK